MITSSRKNGMAEIKITCPEEIWWNESKTEEWRKVEERMKKAGADKEKVRLRTAVDEISFCLQLERNKNKNMRRLLIVVSTALILMNIAQALL